MYKNTLKFSEFAGVFKNSELFFRYRWGLQPRYPCTWVCPCIPTLNQINPLPTLIPTLTLTLTHCHPYTKFQIAEDTLKDQPFILTILAILFCCWDSNSQLKIQ